VDGTPSACPARARPAFIPKEHGSWSLALEPLARGLLVAPSLAGAGLALAALAGFFARRPIRSLVFPAGPGTRSQNLAVLVLLALCAAAGLGEAVMIGSLGSLWTLLLAAPLGGLFLFFDVRKDARAAAAEVAGAAAFSVLPAAFAMLGGWSSRPALALAAAMCARSVPTVIVVRYAVRLGKGQVLGPGLPVVASALGLVAMAALSFHSLVPWTVTALGFLLLVRAVALTAVKPAALVPRRLGLTEAVVGVVFVLGTALAYRL
jgi:hypothetical protein